MMFKGTLTALITPFRDGALDKEGLKRNIHYQLRGGVDGIVVLGTTGEAPTLTYEERQRVIEIAVKEAKGKVPVIVGTGTNCTQTTIAYTREAKDLGADGALIITPYYNRPTQEGVVHHFEALCDAVDLPLCAYDHPGRTGCSLEIPTLKRLAALPTVVALKEATGDLDNLQQVIAELSAAGSDITLVSGNDELCFPAVVLGASGVISVASNLVPEAMAEMIRSARTGDMVGARQQHYTLLALFRALCLESNPIPIKAAMEEWGLPAGECRMPLCTMGEHAHERLKAVLQHYGLLRPSLQN